MKQPQCIPCNGTNPKTGKSVGAIHKWSDHGVCEYCNRTYGQVHGGRMFTPTKFGKHMMPAIAGHTFPRVPGYGV